MKKAILSLILVFFVSIFILGCGGEEIATEKLKFKASNVVFRNSTVKASDEFTDQKVYADDVVLNNANTSLTADNVQGAFEETQPKLSEIIVGEWDVKYYESFCSELKTQEGIIIFNNDGTYTFNNYVGQEFSTDFKPYFGEAIPKSYEIIDESFLSTTSSRNPEEWTKIRDFTFLSSNKLISKGKLEHPDTIYILTRRTEE